MVHPAERLRAVVRSSGDDVALAVEAAAALAAFAEYEGSAGLLVACRRILSHHPTCGPLWWTCARALAAPDPAAAAREAAALLDADRTAERLAASLPLVDPDRVVAVVGWPDALDKALAARGDIAVVAVSVAGEDPVPSLRRRRVERNIRVVVAADLALLDVERVLVGAGALGGGRALVPRGSGEVVRAVGNRPEAWLIGGVGRVLPARLFDAMSAAIESGTDGGAPVEALSLDVFDRVVGHKGRAPPPVAAARAACPAPAALLRPR